MGEVLKCPLCCDQTFESRISLIEHLAGVDSKISCPICDNKWSSIAHLIEHLNLDNCQPDSSTQSLEVPILESNQDGIDKQCVSNEHRNADVVNQDEVTSPQHINKEINDGLDITDNRMYAELISKHMMKPCLQTQELKFIEENGQSRYVFMEEMEPDLGNGSKVVTKLNNDGTISMTTVKDIKMDTDTVLPPSENESEDNQEEMYSCNSCGVSFSSVIEHIQNYHTDQEVVLEHEFQEPVDDVAEVPIEYNDPMMTEGSINDSNFTPRRMITDTGDIVEAPMALKAMDDGDSYHRVVAKQVQTTTGDKMNMFHCIACNVYFSTLSEFKTHPCNSFAPDKAKDAEKSPRAPARRYVQIEKFCDSHVKDIKPINEKDGPFHRAVVKEMETSEGEKVRMYECIVCNIYVTSLSEMKTKPCKPLKYPCPHCPVSYENSKSLCAHMKVHKVHKEPSAEPTTYNCEICCTVFLTNKSLKLHKRMHDPVKARPIEPPVRTVDGIDEVVTDEMRYLCNICNKMIPIDYRTIHQHSHKTSNKMNCTICNKKFQSNEYLEMHMKAHNINKIPENKTDKSLPYSCVYCPRRFARPHEKVKHERIHTGEKPHSCEICGKSFRVSYCLTLHMRTHTGARPYACNHCGKRFKAHSVYNHHLLTHSEKRAYKCPICPKAFKTSVQLAGHKKCHTKPFSCQHCNRPFASLYAVRVHMETHARQNNLKFTCPLCGARYARAFAIKHHVKQVHQLDSDAIEKISDGEKDAWIVRESVEPDSIETHSIKQDMQEVDIPTSKDNSLMTILDRNEEMII